MASATNTKTAKKVKRFRVEVDDVVYMHTPYDHMFGQLGKITHILNDKRVVAKCIAPPAPDYKGSDVVLRTSEPQGNTPSGDPKAEYSFHITAIAFRARPKPPKNPKPLLSAKVIETQEQLLEHLHSDSKEKVVLQLPREEAAS